LAHGGATMAFTVARSDVLPQGAQLTTRAISFSSKNRVKIVRSGTVCHPVQVNGQQGRRGIWAVGLGPSKEH